VGEFGLLHTDEIRRVQTGVVAKAYPVMTINDICMENANNVQNPFPQAITVSKGPDEVNSNAKIKATIVNTRAITYESGTHFWAKSVK